MRTFIGLSPAVGRLSVGRVGTLAAVLGAGTLIGGLGLTPAVADTPEDGSPTPVVSAGAPSAGGTDTTAARPAAGRRPVAATGVGKRRVNRDSAGRLSPAKRNTSLGNSTVLPGSARITQSGHDGPAGPADALANFEDSVKTAVRSVTQSPPAPAAAAIPASAMTAANPSAPSLPAAPSAAKAVSPVKSVLQSLLAPLSGTSPAAPAESPVSWVVLAAARRASRTATSTVTAPTGQTAPLTTNGTTTKITWGWGTNPVLNFRPATDKLDFGWMQASQFDVTEKSGSTVIAVAGNNHSYTLQNIGIGQLTMGNIIARNTGTVSKWQTLISNAQTTLPAVSIANATVAEGNSGTTNDPFTVTLSKPSTKTVTVGYSTANGSATAGSDYTATSGTLTFAPGVTTQIINVAVTGDTAVEPSETFTVALGSAVNAALGAATATGTITNDDVTPTPLPTIAIANAAVPEGNSGTRNMVFTVTLSATANNTITVGYSSANGTAIAGQDYTAASGTLTFAPGATAQQINVSVIGDTTVEPTETFTVTLSGPTNATLSTATATGSITNDDSATQPPTNPPPTTAGRWGTSFYAPYVDMGGWPVPDLTAISQTNGGGSLFTAAFMQSTPDGKLAWAGLNALEPGATNDQAQAINRSIKALQNAGGDVMISLGGQAGTSLAQWGSTHGMTAAQLANGYAGVIDTYGITHLDFDIEGAAVADPASIALHSQALKLLQQSKPTVQIWYTLPVLPTGLTADGLDVVDSALKAGVKLAGVNVMAMDYGESAAPTSGATAETMGAYAIQSAESTYAQLTKLYSGYGQSFGYSQLGVTPMLGVNDVTTEVFTLADAQAVEDYARTKGLGMVALWSVTRDTPGPLGVSTYTHSGMSAPAGSFARILNDYGTVNTLNYPTGGSTTTGGGTTTGGSSTGGSSTGGSTTTVTGGTTTTVGWHWGTDTVLSFNTAKDKLDFGWMQPTNFDIAEKAGSTVITIVNNNQTYTLTGVPLSAMQTGNIAALDPATFAKWQAAIAAAKLL